MIYGRYFDIPTKDIRERSNGTDRFVSSRSGARDIVDNPVGRR